jgi:hypothetical protein
MRTLGTGWRQLVAWPLPQERRSAPTGEGFIAEGAAQELTAEIDGCLAKLPSPSPSDDWRGGDAEPVSFRHQAASCQRPLSGVGHRCDGSASEPFQGGYQ